jgi:acetolactate synthase-1/2/3 large subunit
MRVEKDRYEGRHSGTPPREQVAAASDLTGAESLLLSLVSSGVDTCFANPGTSEMHLVDALDRTAGMRGVLCLFEGVATGAADGYARMTARPAVTLLHLGPGLANGLANLHNARRAQSPIVNIVGDHATWHRQFDSPLTSDIEGFARPVSVFVRSAWSVSEVGRDAAQAVAAAQSARGVATLVTPADISWSRGGKVAAPIQATTALAVAESRIEAATAALRAARRPAILLGSRLLRRAPLEIAGRVAAATGAQL